MSTFECLVYCPAALSDPAIALAACRAGVHGILDFEYAGDALDQGRVNWARLLDALPDKEGAEAGPGLRVTSAQATAVIDALGTLLSRARTIVVAGSDAPALRTAIKRLRKSSAAAIWIETDDAAVAHVLWEGKEAPDGVVARGSECGGRVGDEPAFILTQKLLLWGRAPVIVRGAAGIHTAAGCRAAGARGIVLDDHMLLMPECPLSRAYEDEFAQISGQHVVLAGESLQAPYRVLRRPGATEWQRLAQAERDLNADTSARDDVRSRWRAAIEPLIGWGPGDLWPVGQNIGMARHLRSAHGTVGRLARAVMEDTATQVSAAARLQPFRTNSAFAQAHGAQYPIMQGPMTRVSDTAQFVDAVAWAGGIPTLALALMPPDRSGSLLQETADLLGERPWGVGVLGFAPPETLEPQLDAIRRVRPSFAIVAGGRPDQAKTLESEGIPTYLHLPHPPLFESFYKQGVRRFIFEGRECGGHVGPLHSFALWEQAIVAAMRHVPASEASRTHLVFAGGIHDGLSAAIVSAAVAPLAEMGVRCGLLMGTAYLFTQEAVEAGAIVEGFQQVARDCDVTINVEVSPGHIIRCARTPFTAEFQVMRRDLLREKPSRDDVRDALEEAIRGRLRVASKGLERTAGGDLSAVPPDRQQASGMYMIGQAATMRKDVTTAAQLHEAVCDGAVRIVDEAAARLESAETYRHKPAPSDIAIIGISSYLPGAASTDAYWRNIVDGRGSIVEVPESRWDWRLFFDPDPNAPDKSYSKWGGFLDDIPVDPTQFGIPPNSMKNIGTAQLLALAATRDALRDAGYPDGRFDRENTAVIMANADFGGILGRLLALRSTIPLVMGDVSEAVLDRMPEWSPESFPGLLTNVTAGRVANRFDFGGANFSVDAACASSLTAVDLAVQQLESGRCNLAIAGGVDVGQDPFFYVAFSKTRALSRVGAARPFDSSADGIVLSEGVVIVVLKRLSDAERDGDRIYAVIKGSGASSDGKALGLTAPRPQGQIRAMDRASEKAGVPGSSLDLLEAHGTGTVAGDEAEAETIVSFLGKSGAGERSCCLGSVKSLIGHTKTTAGLAGLTKAALAIYHRVLPGHYGVEQPLAPIHATGSPVYLRDSAAPWLAKGARPRRAGVSAFGFGGTNSHVILEEYAGGFAPEVVGGADWPVELVILGGANLADLQSEARDLLSRIGAGDATLREIARACALRIGKIVASRLYAAFVVPDLPNLRDRMNWLLRRDAEESGALPEGTAMGRPASAPGKVAFLCPGQGAQYAGMARETALYVREMRERFEEAQEVLADRYPRPLSDWTFPAAAFNNDERARQTAALSDTHIAQPSIGAISAGYASMLARVGLLPDVACGHSYGELTALHLGGAFDFASFMRLSEMRGRVMSEFGVADGAMAAVRGSFDAVHEIVRNTSDLTIANINMPNQVVISGKRPAVEAAVGRLAEAGLKSHVLPVSGAFHSQFMRQAGQEFTTLLADMPIAVPRLPVFSNVSSAPLDDTPDHIREALASHLTTPVDFVKLIQAMHDSGARLFVELGPSDILTKFAASSLSGREARFVALDSESGALAGALNGLGKLFCLVEGLRPAALFDDRPIAEPATQAHSEHVWLVNGTVSKRKDGSDSTWGKTRFHTSETAARGENPRSLEKPAPPPIMPARSSGGNMTAYNGENVHPDDVLLKAFEAHQETMREFLRSQEQVIQMFLNPSSGEPHPPRVNQEGHNGFAHHAMPRPAPAPNDGSAQLPAPTNGTHAAGEPSNGVGHPEASSHHRMGVPARQEDEPHTREIAPSPAGSPASAAPIAVADAAALEQVLLKIASDKSGYPTEMLGTELDIEAELGIDSIQRLEILDAFLSALPEAVQARAKNGVGSLSKAKTIRGIVQIVRSFVEPEARETTRQSPARSEAIENAAIPAAVHHHSNPPASAPLEIAPTPKGECPRYVMRAVDAPIERRRAFDPRELVVITADRGSAPDWGNAAQSRGSAPDWGNAAQSRGSAPDWGNATQSRGQMAAALIEELKAAGVRTVLIPAESLGSRGKIADHLAGSLTAAGGSEISVVHLASAGALPIPAEIDDWRHQSDTVIKSLYFVLREIGQDRVKRVLTVSTLGGHFGRNGGFGPGSPLAGGSAGLLNSLRLEWPSTLCRAIDFDASLAPSGVADHLVLELLSDDPHVEVGYSDRRRHAFVARPAPLDVAGDGQAGLAIPAKSVVLVTGGARGITAEVAQSIAQSGMTIAIVGRTPLPTDQDKTVTATGEQELKTHFITEFRRAGTTATPAAISEAVMDLTRKREAADNIERLRRLGATVEYFEGDVRNDSEFSATITGIYRKYGRIDTVIHGAGVIDDKLFVDKTPESFDRVLGTKLDGLFTLSRALDPSTLRHLILFSSVAGRFGNEGQSDYGAANEVMNRFAWRLAADWPSTRIVSINWGPWDSLGMVSPRIRRKFLEKGIEPIGRAAGCAFLLRELQQGGPGDVEVIAGEGPWEAGISRTERTSGQVSVREAVGVGA